MNLGVKNGDFLYVGDNKVRVYYIDNGLLDYCRWIDGASLYGLLRRGDWAAYISPTDPAVVMLLEDQSVHHYKITAKELDLFLRYYCANGIPELDWRKCGF